MARILAVDGGGSKTYAVVVDEDGNRLGSGLAGCGNYQTIGIDAALTHISKACRESLKNAGLSQADVDFVQFGLAGADRPKDVRILNHGLATLGHAQWGLVCDTLEGLRLGSNDFTGGVLVCGAGTNAAGRNKQGVVAQIGGFGYLYGDRAGGFDMARETFSLAVRSWEKREIQSSLVELVPRYFGFSTMSDLINDFLDREVNSVPGDLTLVLHQAAEQGDSLAVRYLCTVGDELALAANAVIQKLAWSKTDPVPLVLVGSVLQMGRSPYILARIQEGIEGQGYKVEMKIPAVHPVYGAALLGFDHLGLVLEPKAQNRLFSYGMTTD